jgi:hypothetical protein
MPHQHPSATSSPRPPANPPRPGPGDPECENRHQKATKSITRSVYAPAKRCHKTENPQTDHTTSPEHQVRTPRRQPAFPAPSVNNRQPPPPPSVDRRHHPDPTPRGICRPLPSSPSRPGVTPRMSTGAIIPTRRAAADVDRRHHPDPTPCGRCRPMPSSPSRPGVTPRMSTDAIIPTRRAAADVDQHHHSGPRHGAHVDRCYHPNPDNPPRMSTDAITSPRRHATQVDRCHHPDPSRIPHGVTTNVPDMSS